MGSHTRATRTLRNGTRLVPCVHNGRWDEPCGRRYPAFIIGSEHSPDVTETLETFTLTRSQY